MLFRTFIVGLSVCVFGSIGLAQSERAVIGTVFDETGAVLPGVTVELTTDTRQVVAVTDNTGSYRFDAVVSAQAALSFRLINFSQTSRDIELIEPEQRVDVVLTLGMTADVVVTGSRTFRNITDLENPRENLVGITTSASVGAITAEQLASRPIMRPGEVLEAVPGFITSQHSGEGKANQYYLRGFNLDHGSDFATTVAGVPMNESSGAHAHGYSDVNLLIPELVSGVQYTKGPYFAEHGDFSAAGSANISYLNVLDRPMLSVSTGGDGWGRVFGAVSPEIGEGNLLVALELSKNNGPWALPDNMKKINGVIRYSEGDTRNGYSVTAMGYSGHWNSTDQIPLRAVKAGTITRFGNLDPTDGGSTKRYSLAFDSLVSGGNQSTRVTVYGLRGKLNLFQNFTYFLTDPVNGDQVEQAAGRWVYGGKVVHRRLGRMFGRHTESSVGVSTRHDNVGVVGLYPTVRKRRIGAHRQDRVQQTTLGVFVQSEVEWTDRFRTTLGIRGDGYRYTVDAIRPLNDGQGTSGLVSPKLTAVFGPWGGSELYVNYGRGYHSNDPRAATTQVDPITGGPVDSASPIVPARGSEIGFRSVAVPRLQSTVALWYLAFDSELIFVGDAGIAEASRPSRRYGVEWTNYVNLADWLTGELDMSFSDARFSDFDVAGFYIPGALDRVIAGGLTVSQGQRVFGSIRVRHFGARPLIEDYSVKSEPTTILNGEVGFRLNEKLNVVFEAFNLLNSDVSDIDYYYASRLPGEPLAGVDDVHFHPSLPRTARVMLNVSF
jgi:hypothetical protein